MRYGAWSMFSMPPATATLILPREISCAEETMACAPEPQTRLTVRAGVVTGSPAWTAAWRAGFILVPAWTTLTITTVSTSSGRMFARVTAAAIATASGVRAGTSFSEPRKGPLAVRIGSAKTTERCDVMANLSIRASVCLRPAPPPRTSARTLGQFGPDYARRMQPFGLDAAGCDRVHADIARAGPGG